MAVPQQRARELVRRGILRAGRGDENAIMALIMLLDIEERLSAVGKMLITERDWANPDVSVL